MPREHTSPDQETEMTYQVAQRFFWLFISIHTLLWTIGPLLSRSSLPHDTLESIAWGMQWQLGYNKHPFLAAWLTAGISSLFHAVEWPVYLLAQLAVSITWITVWRLARTMLPATQAVIAALLLDGILFYNINSFNLTPDTLQSPLWALLTLSFYRALSTQTIRYWLITGLLSALCIITKYQAILLLFPMLLMCLTNKHARASFRHKGLYLGLITALIGISPHMLWLYQHDFATVQYAISAPYHNNNHYAPMMSLLRYVLDSLGYIAGVLLLLWPFYGKEKMDYSTVPFDRQFLLYLGLGPFLLTCFCCFISGEHFPARWSTPYFSLIGIIAMTYMKPQITPHQFKQFAITLAIVSSLLWGIRIGSIATNPHSKSDAHLPNKAVATLLTQVWREHYQTPLPYIGGAHYLVASSVAYCQDKPIPYFSFSQDESPWLAEKDVTQKGALFVWDDDKNYDWDGYSPKISHPTPQIKQRFPNLILLGSRTFYRTNSDALPVKISIGLLPPAPSIVER